MAWQDAYSDPGVPFGAKGPFYDARIGHRGQDYVVDAGEVVPAYEDCTIEYVGETGGLGLVVGARLHDSKGPNGETLYAGWAHLVGNPGSGAVLKRGDGIATVAGWGDNHGSLWAGAHIHTTISNQSSYSAAVGLLPLYDPKPIIDKNLASTAGGGSTPVPPTPSNKKIGDDDVAQYFRNAETGQIGYFAGRGVKIFGSQDDYKKHRETMTAWLKASANSAAKANGTVTLPPNEGNDNNFVNLDPAHWAIEIAVRGGTY